MALEPVRGDHHHFAVLDLAHELGADHVECARLGCEHVSVAKTADDKRADADGVARADQHVVGEADERPGALDLADRLDEPLDHAPLAASATGDGG